MRTRRPMGFRRDAYHPTKYLSVLAVVGEKRFRRSLVGERGRPR
jgi:hypothetical protein